MTDLIVIAILFIVIGSAVGYMVKAKKRGVTCIGCTGGSCASCHQSDSVSPCGCESSYHTDAM